MFRENHTKSFCVNPGINDIDSPQHCWIQIRSGLYLKPLIINLCENSLLFYSLVKTPLAGVPHYHTGLSHGIILRGKFTLEERYAGKIQSIDSGGFYYSPAGIIQTATQMCDHDGIWLAYGVLHGNIIYLDENEQPLKSFDSHVAFNLLNKHCEQHDIDLKTLQVKIVNAY